MTGYPRSVATVNQIEAAPRRVRAMLGGQAVLDTSRALYLWEWPNYPRHVRVELEGVDITRDGSPLERPTTHFS